MPLGSMTHPAPPADSGSPKGESTNPFGSDGASRSMGFEGRLLAFVRDQPVAAAFLDDLAHELRSPLAAVRVSVELLQKPSLPEAMRDRALGALSRQVSALGVLVDALARSAQGAAPLPAGGATAADASPPKSAARALRVLIADDNAHVRQSMLQLLSAEGYVVRTAADGEAAIALATAWRPHVVILDAYMPGMSGVDAARRLRLASHDAGMKLLLMSGVALTDAWAAHAREAGFDDCLDKGAPPSHWLERLRFHTDLPAPPGPVDPTG
jgi:CheY-like chemotaxis protein